MREGCSGDIEDTVSTWVKAVIVDKSEEVRGA